jgi:hypothetical protein
MTAERLESFTAAWGRKDVDELMSFMTEDCVYNASVGPDPGATYVGRESVCKSRGGRVFVAVDRGAAEWSYVFTDDAGREVELRGCDLFEFVGDKIRRKDAYRKTYS